MHIFSLPANIFFITKEKNGKGNYNCGNGASASTMLIKGEKIGTDYTDK